MAEDSPAYKTQMVTALSAMLLADAGVDISAENMSATISAAGCSVPDNTVAMYASFVEKAGGVSKFMAGPSAGGGGGGSGGGGGDAAASAPKEEAPKEEEVDPMEGGMDMFGGGGDY